MFAALFRSADSFQIVFASKPRFSTARARERPLQTGGYLHSRPLRIVQGFWALRDSPPWVSRV